MTQLQQRLADISLAEAEAKAAAAAAQTTLTAVHAQERQQLQLHQQELEQIVRQLEHKVQFLEQDTSIKQQQQEELTSMCAQVFDQATCY